MPIEPLTEAIMAIYESALAREAWFGALHRIAELSGSSGCRIVIDVERAKRLVFSVERGIERQTSGYLTEAKGPSASTKATELVSPGELVVQSRIGNRTLIGSAEKWQDLDVSDALVVVLLNTEAGGAFLEAVKADRQNIYTDYDLEHIRLLAPHLCRALRLFGNINASRLTSEMFEASLEALSAGVYLVDEDGTVVYLNRVARTQTEAGRVLRLVEGRLVVSDREAQNRVITELRDIRRDADVEQRPGVAVALGDGAGSGFIAHVLPLSGTAQARIAHHFAAIAAIFVQDPAMAPPPANEAFARLYGLTDGELRLLNGLMPGLSLSETAALVGISEATAKTHLHRIFNKTKTSRQTELLYLLMTSTPPTVPR